MYIIDKNKDFYDHYSYIYGVDKTITFDRRGSEILSNDYFAPTLYRHLVGDELKAYFLLEIGYTQYLLQSKYRYMNTSSSMITPDYILKELYFKILKSFRDNKNIFGKELSVVRVEPPYEYIRRFDWMKTKNIDDITLSEINTEGYEAKHNFIMSNTKLTSILDPEIIWKDINVFISSKSNDKSIDIINSDKDKIINHGFDMKTSFRNPVK